jgi:putative ABC transport system substrate-binding protein
VITRRSALILGAYGLVTPLAAFAQRERLFRVGILVGGDRASFGALVDRFTETLRKLGYEEGKNLLLERRFADGDFDRLRVLAQDIAQRRVDVIFAPNTVEARAAKQVAEAVPIVFATAGSPLTAGFASSLAKPDRNMTGTTNVTPDLTSKRLQLLKDLHPKMSRLAVFDIRTVPTRNGFRYVLS